MERIFIHLGSNLGDRRQYLEAAIAAIEKQVGPLVARSSLYETEAWGTQAQPDFLNMAIELSTNLDPEALMLCLLRIEAELGRLRSENEIRGPRTIDLDLLAYGNRAQESPLLILPHPRMHLRNFVLVPLMDLAAEWEHPVLGKSIEELYWDSSDNSDVLRLDEETNAI